VRQPRNHQIVGLPKNTEVVDLQRLIKSGRQDLNLRPFDPQSTTVGETMAQLRRNLKNQYSQTTDNSRPGCELRSVGGILGGIAVCGVGLGIGDLLEACQ